MSLNKPFPAALTRSVPFSRLFFFTKFAVPARLQAFTGISFVIAVSSLFVVSCKKSAVPQPAIAKDVTLPPNGASVVQAGQDFAFDFFRANQQTDNTAANKLVSPLSIYLALGMACNGAAHATQDSIEKALRLKNLTLDDLNKTSQALMQQLPLADNKVELSIANSIWYRQGFQPLPGFLDITQKDYAATVRALDFANPASVATINKWASDNTKQKIPQILGNISANDLLYLINAVYFKGTWKYQFNKNDTKNADFYRADQSAVSAPFMYAHQTPLGYFRNDSLQMVQLPYGAGNFTMYVLLPGANLTATTLLAGLNAASFQSWKDKSSPTAMDLFMPKFSYRYTIDNMQPALSLMGMGIAFSNQADFSGMYTIPVQITKAIHKTYINTNEEGTEAAAVTAIGMGTTSSMPLSVNLNHPFIYIIQEKTSGAILFTGLVNDPTL